MNSTIKVSGIVIFGVLVSIILPYAITPNTSKVMEKKSETTNASKNTNQTSSRSIVMAEKKVTSVPLANDKPEEKVEQVAEETQEEKTEENKEEKAEVKKEETEVKETPAPVEVQAPSVPEAKPYNDMTTEEMIAAISNGSFKLEYSAVYNTNTRKLTKSVGALYYNGHKETYYSQRVLPGSSLKIPGRHVADDGTVRDGDGYICVAANTSYLSRGAVVKTSLGPAKVYDSGCASGTIDIYTNW